MSSTTRNLVYIDGEPHWLTEEEMQSYGLVPDERVITPGVAAGYSEKRPGKSIAMSVHPDEIPAMNEFCKKCGIRGVEFDPTKRDNCVITSRTGRRDFLKARGYFDGDGGYGD